MIGVVHVSAAAERGGLEVIFLNILRCLDRSRFAPQVVFLTDGPFVGEVQEAGIETHVINAGRVREIVKGGSAIVKLTRLIRDQGIDIVHTHNAKAHVYGGLAARIAGIPALYHLQGVPKPSFTRDGLVSLLSFAIPARQTIACSNYVAHAFQSVWHSRRKVLVVHSGIVPRTNSATVQAPTVRQEFGIPDGVPLVVMATRLQRWKGVHVFLDSAAQIVQKYREARFMVVGGTLFGLGEDYAEELRRQVERLQLANAVVFTGYRADVARFFEAADVVVHASIEPDPFPTVLLEAMDCAKPVVASDSGGPREIVQHAVTGFLVQPDQPDLQAQAVLRLIDNRDLGLQMGRAGATRVRTEFTAVRMTKRIELLYEGLIGENRV
jgi:glycosyltransferase involved in cell wall biosynthesis